MHPVLIEAPQPGQLLFHACKGLDMLYDQISTLGSCSFEQDKLPLI